MMEDLDLSRAPWRVPPSTIAGLLTWRREPRNMRKLLGNKRVQASRKFSAACPVLPDDLQKFVAIARELHRSDPVDQAHLLKRCRLAARHVEETAIGQNHIGGHRFGPGKRRAA